MSDGAVLIVDRSVEPTHNKIVIASIDGSYACKRLLLKPRVSLMSENPKYPPIFINKEEELELAGTIGGKIQFPLHPQRKLQANQILLICLWYR